MNWTEFERTWQDALPRFQAPAWDVGQFEQQRRRLARTLARRDWLEAGVSFGVAAFFTAVLWPLGLKVGPAWGSVAILVVMGVVFVRERRRARALLPDPGAPLRARVEAEIAELEHQRRLLGGVLWWYVLPFLAVVGLLLWGVHAALPGPVTSEAWLRIGWFGATCVGLGGAVVWLNRVAVRRSIEPQLRDLQRLRDELAG
jgi:hypothetical protein